MWLHVAGIHKIFLRGKYKKVHGLERPLWRGYHKNNKYIAIISSNIADCYIRVYFVIGSCQW